MLRKLSMWAMLGAAAVLLGGCFVRARTYPATYSAGYNAGYVQPGYVQQGYVQQGYADGVVVYQAPPPAQVVVQPPVPYQGAVWVQGNWNWNGSQYLWGQGHYEQARAGHVYVQPRWHRRGTGYVYAGGGWRAGARGRAVRREHRQQRRVYRRRGGHRGRAGVRVTAPRVAVPRVHGRATVEVR